MNRFEKRNRAIDEAIRGKIAEYKAIYKKAEDDDRDPSDEERLEIESCLKAIETLKSEKDGVEENIKTLQHVDDIGREIGPALGNVSVGREPQDRVFEEANRIVGQALPHVVHGLGDQFVSSKGYKSLMDKVKEDRGFNGDWSTGPVQLDLKGTLLEGSSAPGSGTGGGLLPVPQVVGGVVDTLFQRLTIANLLLSGVSDTNTVRYIVEGTATSGAAGVAEAGTKPESSLGLSTKDEPIKKIATFLPVSEEMLEDASQVQSYINQRLALFVAIEEERQLLRGTASGNEIQGILTSRGVPVYVGGTVDSIVDQVFKGLNSMRGSAFVEPEWMIVHPTDWQTLRLTKDTANQYYGGGPFGGSYGGAVGQTSPSSQVNGPQDTLWNKPVYVTAAIGGSGTALIGTTANAQVWRRGGLSVEASNSHASFFQLNMIAIRCEERLGLAVYRPTAYTEVHLNKTS